MQVSKVRHFWLASSIAKTIECGLLITIANLRSSCWKLEAAEARRPGLAVLYMQFAVNE